MKVVKHGNSGLRAVVAWWLNQVDLGPRGFRVDSTSCQVTTSYTLLPGQIKLPPPSSAWVIGENLVVCAVVCCVMYVCTYNVCT